VVNFKFLLRATTQSPEPLSVSRFAQHRSRSLNSKRPKKEPQNEN